PRRSQRQPLHLPLPPPDGMERRRASAGHHGRDRLRPAPRRLCPGAGSPGLPRGARVQPRPHLGQRVPRLPRLRGPGGPGLLQESPRPRTEEGRPAAARGATGRHRSGSGARARPPMNPVPEAPLRISIAVCAYVLLVVWVTLRGLDLGLRRSGCASPIRRSLLGRIGALLGTWFVAITAGAASGAWLDPEFPRAVGYMAPALL